MTLVHACPYFFLSFFSTPARSVLVRKDFSRVPDALLARVRQGLKMMRQKAGTLGLRKDMTPGALYLLYGRACHARGTRALAGQRNCFDATSPDVGKMTS